MIRGGAGDWRLAALGLLAAFAIMLAGLGWDGLGDDEAWTAWAVRSPYVMDTLMHVRDDGQPPLYFLLLDGWTLAVGESVFALRLPSVWYALVGLAAVYALGARLFDRLTGMYALALLATASLCVYYVREARMYSLLLLLAVLATWAYIRWRSRPTIRRALPYAALLMVLLYTHEAGALVIVAQVAHLLLTLIPPTPFPRTRRKGEQITSKRLSFGVRMIIPYALALAAFVPWLPVMLAPRRANPVVLLAPSGVVAVLLPAGALLLACALRRIRLPGGGHAVPLQNVLLAGLLCLQLVACPALWPARPTWEAALRQMIAVRQPLEPTIMAFAPYSPAAYYARQLPVRQGVSVDLSWRRHSLPELRDIVTVFEQMPSVWVALPMNTAQAWSVAALLNEGRGAGYRTGLDHMIFYRFDRQPVGDLAFRFGDQLRYKDGPGAATQFSVSPADELCLDYHFFALKFLEDSYSAGLHLVDGTGTISAAPYDAGLGSWYAGDLLHFSPCLTIPTDAAPGYYHLELAVYNKATGERLPVIEDGGGAGVNWGDVMRLAAVTVSE